MSALPAHDISAIEGFVSTPTRPSKTRAGREANSHLLRQLDSINELLLTMDTLTVPGQAQTMRKIVGFVDVQLESRLGLGARNRRTLAEHVSLLKGASERRWPDVAAFSLHAENALTLLRAAS